MTFPKWVKSIRFGVYHLFDDATMRSLCGRHETDSTETKTPGAPYCRPCLDASAVPADDWRRRDAIDEADPEPEASVLTQTESGLWLVGRGPV